MTAGPASSACWGRPPRLGPARVAVVYHPYYERFAAWAAQVLGRGDHARYAGSGGGPYSGWHVDLGPRARQDRASRTIALLLADPARHGTHPGESHRAGIIAAHSAGTELVLASVLLRWKGLLWTQDYLQRRARLSPAGTAEIFVALTETEPDPDEMALARLRLPCSPCSTGCGATSRQRHAPWLPVKSRSPGQVRSMRSPGPAVQYGT